MARFSQNYYSGIPGQGSLLGRIVAFVVGAIVLGVALFVGAAVFLAVLGLMVIGGLIMAVRVWWIKRKVEQYAREHGDLQGEYTVIEERQEVIQHRNRMRGGDE